MLKELTIFDIPIYSMSECSYEKRISRLCEGQSRKCAQSEDDFLALRYHYISSMKSDSPWRYNQIVGALRITITNDENIELRLFFIDKQRIKYFSKTKHIIKNRYISDLRIKNVLTKYRTDRELKNKLNDLIEHAIKTYVNNDSHKYFVDTEIYDNLLKHINLRKLVLEMNRT